ncbi:hypothetical protein L7F22_034032 [Adiantum nelumboides]|nr:hypothetical protein [Adiantum nelumboides]
MDCEYQSLMANGTWQLVPAPPNRKLVTCKWLLRKKFHADGSVSRYKARLVARGFTQIPGMDYSEIFSPVLCITSFRILIAIAALFGFLLHQMDVRTAFLNGDLQEEIYMSQPDGGYTSLQHPDYVCRLLKALYGLKQSPRQWYLRFHQSIYVYDILILSNSQYAIDKAKGELQASFSMIDMGTLHYCLGIQRIRAPTQAHITASASTKTTKVHRAVSSHGGGDGLCVAEKRQVRCDYAKFILESLIEVNLKNLAKNKLYMNVEPMLTRIAYQALRMIEDLPSASSQAALIQQAKYVPKAVKTTSSATSSRSTRSKKSSSKEERTETDKEQDSQESAQEDVPKEAEASVPFEYESDEEDTSVPLERKSQKPRSREQVLMDEAMARVEAKRKELADARAAKAAGKTRPMTMEEAKKIRLEKAKAIQKERRRIEAEQKAQEEFKAAQAAQTQEREVINLSGTVEYLKKLEREKHTAEQRAAQLAREKIKEALSRKAEEPVLEPTQGSPKRPRQEEEEEIEHI